MSKRPRKGSLVKRQDELAGYSTALVEIVELLEDARRLASHSVNTIMTAAYWEIGRHIVEIEQQGKGKADYGEQVIDRLSRDLTARLGRGFGRRNLFQMRAFYLAYSEIVQTPSAQSEGAPGPDTTPRQGLKSLPRLPDDRPRQAFPLSWSHYVKLLAVKSPKAREFYEGVLTS
jgi:hypothetical protein